MSTRLVLLLSALAALASQPAFSREHEDAKALCDSLNLQAVPCYVHWAPATLNLLSVGVAMRVQQGASNVGTDKAANEQIEQVYKYAKPQLKEDPKKLEQLERAHRYAKQSLKAIMPREGVAEADRAKEASKRKAQLTKLLEPLSAAPKG